MTEKDTFQKIDEFHDERIEKLKQGKVPKPFPDGGKIVLQLIPLESFDGPKQYDLSVYDGQFEIVKPSSGFPFDQEFNFDGLLYFALGGDNLCLRYLQIYFNGMIEKVDGYYLRKIEGEKTQAISSIFSIEEELVGDTKQYLLFQRELGIKPPIVLYLDFLRVKGFKIELGSKNPDVFDRIHPIDRDDLNFPKIIIENIDVPIEKLLKPNLDRLYNACGYPRSFHYDEKGQWSKR